MKYQITFYYYSDLNRLTHLKTITAKSYGDAYNKFFDEITEEVFILEINEETNL